jgi:hypothetical protein
LIPVEAIKPLLAPPEIFRPIVRPYSVDVVNVSADLWAAVRNKSPSDKPMDADFGVNTKTGQRKHWVAVIADEVLQYLRPNAKR